MYTLYYAPDNASLIVRIVLEELGADYDAILVDRSAVEQRGEAYRQLNPNGLIPVCIIDGEPVFETAAIILALAERHGALAPGPEDARRPQFLKWLFFLSNTVHPDLRQLFYPEQYVGLKAAFARHSDLTRQRLRRHFDILESHYSRLAGPYLHDGGPTIVDIYTAFCLRWPQLYPTSALDIFEPADHPVLCRMLTALQARPAVIRSFSAEGIPAPYFLSPRYPDGTRGTAMQFPQP